jgi:hypothetical protein
MNNPLEFSHELSTEQLVDRADEVAAIVQTICQGSKLFLVGSRRFGKSGRQSVTHRINEEFQWCHVSRFNECDRSAVLQVPVW